jgi:hypothetical protein
LRELTSRFAIPAGLRHKGGAMRRAMLSLFLLTAACGEPVELANSGETANETAPDPIVPQARPVRVGELGPNFKACTAAGATRNLKPGEMLPVRSSPFENAAEAAGVPAGARFFVCSASHDRKWMGIVFDESGTLAERCGVSAPLRARRDYEGPCRSGWVQSAFVKLVAGTDQPLPAVTPDSGSETNSADSAPAGA